MYTKTHSVRHQYLRLYMLHGGMISQIKKLIRTDVEESMSWPNKM